MPCVRTSTVDNAIGLKELYGVMKGKLSCFRDKARWAILHNQPHNRRRSHESKRFDAKAQRKSIQRHIEIFDYGEGRVVDTCGFSLLEIDKLKPEEWLITKTM